MRILLDENLPELLVSQLSALGHHVDSVNSLKLKGLDNGSLFSVAASDYDILFTKDRGFAESIQDLESNAKVKLILVTLRQEPAKQFVARFLKRFSETDWTSYASGDIWPSE